jgi:hypothetical protein
MPYRPRRRRDRLDLQSPVDRMELTLIVEPPHDPAKRERLWHLWQQHGARLIEQDGPQRWDNAIRTLSQPPLHREPSELRIPRCDPVKIQPRPA